MTLILPCFCWYDKYVHNCKEKSPSELSWAVWAPEHSEACIILLSGLCSSLVRSSLTLCWICVIHLDVRKDILGCQYCCCCFCVGKDASWFHLQLLAVSMRVHGDAVKELLRTQLSFMWQLQSSSSHTGRGWHWASPEPSTHRSSGLGEHACGGQMQCWEEERAV